VRLWHLPISHFSEKVRWALDFKRLPHSRRVMPPGLHPLGGLMLTRGRAVTMPVLSVGGRAVADSSAIIGCLEERFPGAPALYPAGAAERVRALELEEFFDEQLGPYARRWAFHEMTRDPAALRSFALKQVEWAPEPLQIEAFGVVARYFVELRYATADDAGAEEAERKIVAAFDRLEAELGSSSAFLAGDSFSVADLTAAALFYPVVLPDEGPWRPSPLPAGYERLRSQIRDRPGYRWVEDTFRRWRRSGANASV
jgi:glutathione S-transferase